MAGMTRRAALAAIAQLAAAASFPGNGLAAGAQGGPAQQDDLELLASVAYDLFPYDELVPAVYVTAAQAIVATDDPALADGLKSLKDKMGGRHWRDVPEAMRIKILTSLEGTPFFALIRANAANALYNDPAVWTIVGYGGPALEKGGYINRGFDDIDWLPQAEGR